MTAVQAKASRTPNLEQVLPAAARMATPNLNPHAARRRRAATALHVPPLAVGPSPSRSLQPAAGLDLDPPRGVIEVKTAGMVIGARTGKRKIGTATGIDVTETGTATGTKSGTDVNERGMMIETGVTGTLGVMTVGSATGITKTGGNVTVIMKSAVRTQRMSTAVAMVPGTAIVTEVVTNAVQQKEARVVVAAAAAVAVVRATIREIRVPPAAQPAAVVDQKEGEVRLGRDHRDHLPPRKRKSQTKKLILTKKMRTPR